VRKSGWGMEGEETNEGRGRKLERLLEAYRDRLATPDLTDANTARFPRCSALVHSHKARELAAPCTRENGDTEADVAIPSQRFDARVVPPNASNTTGAKTRPLAAAHGDHFLFFASSAV